MSVSTSHPVTPDARRTWRIWLVWIVTVAVLFAAAVFTTAQFVPSLTSQQRDSGVYGYGGMVLERGGVMYVDVWDNKLPGVHTINALSFAVLGVGRWAQWWADVIFVWAASVALYWLIYEAFGFRWLAWAAALIFLLFAHYDVIVSDVGYTELYALLPQVLAFAFGFQFLRQPRYRWTFLVGLSTAVALIIKQSTVSFAPAYIAAILLAGPAVRGSADRWRYLGVTILGGLTGLGTLALYLLVHGVLITGIEAGFVAPGEFHHWVGAVPFLSTIKQTLLDSKVPEVYGPLGWVLIPGVLAAGWWSLRRTYTPQSGARATLALWATITFPLDLVLVNPTGRGASQGYEHYYATLIPALMILMAAGIAGLARLRRVPMWGRGLLVLAAVAWCGYHAGERPWDVTTDRLEKADWDVSGPPILGSLSKYVVANTQPDDAVLNWGASPYINFQSGRLSPTKYFYAYGLLVPGEDSDRRIADMVSELDAAPPAMIVDTTMYDGNRVPPLDAELRAAWWTRGGRQDVANLSPLYDWVAANCTVTDRVDWVMVYRCQG